MQLTTTMTKAQKLKVIEGFNFERATGQSQYKYRNGTYIMEGGDTARRLQLVSTLITGKPCEIEEASLENFVDVVYMQSVCDRFFSMYNDKEGQDKLGAKILERFAK
ncbi:hypothetical protein VPHK567_0319 [Vibrio phage K567]